MQTIWTLQRSVEVIYKALCFDVAQGRMNGAPNETEECGMYTETYVWVRRYLQTLIYLHKSESKRYSTRRKYTVSPVKIVLDTPVRKEVHVEFLLGQESTHNYWLLLGTKIEPTQILFVIVYLGVMAMKGYSTLFWSPELDPLNPVLFSVMPLFGGVECSFYSILIGQRNWYHKIVKKKWLFL